MLQYYGEALDGTPRDSLSQQLYDEAAQPLDPGHRLILEVASGCIFGVQQHH